MTRRFDYNSDDTKLFLLSGRPNYQICKDRSLSSRIDQTIIRQTAGKCRMKCYIVCYFLKQKASVNNTVNPTRSSEFLSGQFALGKSFGLSVLSVYRLILVLPKLYSLVSGSKICCYWLISLFGLIFTIQSLEPKLVVVILLSALCLRKVYQK